MSSFARDNASLPVRGSAWTIICLMILPMSVVFAVSVTDRPYLSLPENGVSLQYYRNLFTSPEWLLSIWQSFVIACVSTMVAGALGTLGSIGCWRISSGASNVLRLVMLVPLMLPPIVYGLGAYQVWADLGWINTYTGIIVAHAMTGIPYVVITVSTALAGLDPKLEQAARSLGAGMGATIWYVIFPNIMPGILSGLVFAFIHSWDELVIALFIAGRNVFTLPRRMWDGINENLDPTMAAVASVLILVTLGLLVFELLGRGRKR
ncbi:ABC transporter permease [Rhodobacteraceae bacterium F11138]|nr:ABC transporter permease [Rhodobacteraceae bacterium F11138]